MHLEMLATQALFYALNATVLHRPGTKLSHKKSPEASSTPIVLRIYQVKKGPISTRIKLVKNNLILALPRQPS